MTEHYWSDIKVACNMRLLHYVENVSINITKEYMPTFLFTDTFKYCYLNFSYKIGSYNFKDYLLLPKQININALYLIKMKQRFA